ncbi:MAG: 3-deoxy-D-manno-octulosonic acid transferase [Phycisphaerales bacterium]
MDAIYLVAAGVASPWLLRKKRLGWDERLARAPSVPVKAAGKRRLLIHAVSVGETNLIRPLVDLLWEEFDLVIASTTDTGRARAVELYSKKATCVRFPLDLSGAVRRFLDAVAPDGVALVELELWPNFMGECAKRGIPVGVVNGRLSDRSYGRYRMAKPLIGKYFRQLAFVGAQDATYAERFVGVGADPSVVSVCGTMKWDAASVTDDVPGSAELATAMRIDRAKPLIVAGSTEPMEHALLRDAKPAGVQLLCAPRKPEWFEDAARDLPGCTRRSRAKAGSSDEFFLLDTIGELRKAYALADVVVVGRSFGELYGSDPMDPAALGKCVVIGPNVDDFRTAVEILEKGGGIVRTTREGLRGELARLLGNAEQRRAIGERARAVVVREQGSARKHATFVQTMLSSGNRAHLSRSIQEGART